MDCANRIEIESFITDINECLNKQYSEIECYRRLKTSLIKSRNKRKIKSYTKNPIFIWTTRMTPKKNKFWWFWNVIFMKVQVSHLKDKKAI